MQRAVRQVESAKAFILPAEKSADLRRPADARGLLAALLWLLLRDRETI